MNLKMLFVATMSQGLVQPAPDWLSAAYMLSTLLVLVPEHHYDTSHPTSPELDTIHKKQLEAMGQY